jgi:hypothetical protein
MAFPNLVIRNTKTSVRGLAGASTIPATCLSRNSSDAKELFHIGLIFFFIGQLIHKF